MTTTIGFGVLGANSFVANAAVMPAIDAAATARLVATASRSAPVPDRWSASAVTDYDAVLAHPDVDAVYIPLPNGMHREWTERAAAAGKHVLCEKPLAADAATAQAMAEACTRADVLLAEAWMTPFDRRWSTVIERLRAGVIGEVASQHHRFTFTIGPDASDNYRWDRGNGGGALLDVGIYCVGTAVELWGTGCTVESVRRTLSGSGVDASTTARLRWPGGRTADVECSFVDPEHQTAQFQGTAGALTLEDAAFTSGHPRDDVIVHTTADGSREEWRIAPGDPYQAMIESFANAIGNRVEWPRPIERSIELLELLEHMARAEPAAEAETETETDA